MGRPSPFIATLSNELRYTINTGLPSLLLLSPEDGHGFVTGSGLVQFMKPNPGIHKLQYKFLKSLLRGNVLGERKYPEEEGCHGSRT
jgi:hypothetical protein